jgi:hypothetical protein
MSRRVVGYPVALREASKEQAYALEASVHRRRCVGLFMNQVGPKRRQVDGPDLDEPRRIGLVDPGKPRVKTGQIMEIGSHGRQCQVASQHLVTERFHERYIRIGVRR